MDLWLTLAILSGYRILVADTQCNCPTGWETVSGRYSHKTYDILPDNVNVPNPGRGFFKQVPAFASQFHDLRSNAIAPDRTVVQRMYYMDTYINKSLDQEFIRHVKTDLNFIKHQGWMGILRFSYTPKRDGVHDAGLQRALEHIKYLGDSSLFQDYEGVIATIQAGFIGVWGEWHYATSDFGQPGGCSADHMFRLTTSQWSAREQVLKALLTVVPKSIQIELRYPWLKYTMFGDTPTTFQDILDRTDRGRVGFHNDAFLTTTANLGTYKCAGDRDYFERESRYFVISGEASMNKTVSIFGCNNAMAEMTRYHWSLLNEGFLREVINYWKEHGCHEEIAAKLGYRLYLRNATLPDIVQSGGSMCFELNIGNNGYAAPYKEMELHIVLKNTHDGVLYGLQVQGYDVRQWQPGMTYTVKGEFGIPADLHGTFKVFFALTDKIMQYNEKYFVMMANSNMNTSSLRINDLMHVVNITGGGVCKMHAINPISYWKGHADGCISMEVLDGSFEDDALGWSIVDQGYSVVTGLDALGGNKYITVTNGGALQVFDFSRSPINGFTLSGYSRSHSDTSVQITRQYSIKCDISHTDGSHTWGRHVDFDQNVRDVWMFRKLVVQTQKPIKSARCYALFKTGNGTVDFDNFVLNTCIQSDCTHNFTDGSFEDVLTWKPSRNGYQMRTNQNDAINGHSYITISNGTAFQTINFTGSAITEFSVRGYSRVHGVAVKSPSDYYIHCNLQYADGSSSTGEYGLFDPTASSTTWQRADLHVTSSKVITYATCHATLTGLSGDADFDDFQISSCL